MDNVFQKYRLAFIAVAVAIVAAFSSLFVVPETKQAVIIRADKRVQFDHVGTVMNLCNQVGIFNYTVTTAGDGS